MISGLLRTLIVTMISSFSAAALVLGYCGLLEGIALHASRAGAFLGFCVICGWVALLMIRHRDDLTDRTWITVYHRVELRRGNIDAR